MSSFFLIAAGFAATANAATITFNGVAADGSFSDQSGRAYSEAGFTLQANSISFPSHFIIDNDYDSPDSGALPDAPGLDDDYYEFNHQDATLTVKADSGNPFNFDSIVISALGTSANAELVFTGYFSGGGSIVETVGASFGSYDTFNPSGFTGLSSLVISTTTSGFYPLFDDLVLTEVSAVPLPAAGLLLITAVSGLAFVRRFRRA